MSDLADRLSRLTPAQRALLDARTRGRTPAQPALSRIPRRRRADRSRLTVDQERIWLIHQFDPDDPVYNVFFAVRMRGELDSGALQHAVDALVQRHEALRTTFELDGEGPVQVVHATMRVPVRCVALGGTGAAARERELHRRATEEVSQAFDLTTGPLLRITLLQLNQSETVLVLTVDHLVWDRASAGILERELAALYTEAVTGRPAGLEPLPIQYADYAEWQPQWITHEVRRKQLPYWKHHLAGSTLVLDLPTDLPRPPVQTFNGARYQFRLTPELSAALRALARAEDVTLNVALLAAWKLLLHRYSGQTDIVVGTTSSTRSRPETEPLIGYFLTMLALRTEVRGAMSFRDLLAATRSTMVGAFDHHDMPFGLLLDELDIARDPSRNPVYQASFILVDFYEEPVAMPGLTLEPMVFDNHTAKDEVSLCVFDDQASTDHLFGLFEYNTDLFTEATVARMWHLLERLLQQVTDDPGRPIAELSLMAPDEAERVLVEWNRTGVAREDGAGVHHLVARQAAATPDAVAVAADGERLTYAELMERAARLAGHLRARGAGEETVVGVCLDRSCDLVVTLLGVLMAGAAYLPLDPDYPSHRLEYVLASASAGLLVTHAHLADRCAAFAGPVLRLDREREALARAAPLPAPAAASGDRLAYVIYTSGSTGRPKGVEVTHAGVVNLLLAMTGEVGLGGDDVLAAVTSVSFDIAGLELFGPLVTGGQVALATRGVAQDGRGLAAWLDEVAATVMQATPATWQMLLEAGWRSDGRLRVVVGGEALPPSLAHRLVAGPGRTWNVYGPTETTIWSTAARLDGPAEPITLGRPIANTEVYVLDDRLEPVPVGLPGELFLGGAGVARGYRGQPATTAERFVPDHLGPRPGARLYRTGDRVRMRGEGTLDFLGRLDNQVKLRGYRIELGEIERNLEEHPGVARAAVLVREDRPGDRRLVAYVQGRGEPPGDALREHLRAYLPEYMVPSSFVQLDAFPLTTSGKLDRQALPAPSGGSPTGGYVAPRDPVELAVAQIWESVLDTRPIGIRDRFFDLGGHSLLALRLMLEIERRFERRLPVAAILQGATVERFAGMLREGYAGDPREHLVEIRPGSSGTPVFFAHPAGSEVVCYMPFASLLEPHDRPLYAIAPPALSGSARSFERFEQRAAAYADLVRAVQPSGPYVLAGWCYGGVNAFAIAHELERAGEDVSVFLIDAHPPSEQPQGSDPDRAAIVEGLALNLQWDYGDDLKSLDELRRLGDDEHIDYLLALARRGNWLPADAGHAQMRAVLDLWIANLRLLWRYRPTPLGGRLTLVRASEEEPALYEQWHRWTRQDLRVRAVPGNHYTIMRVPNIHGVVDVINDHLAEEAER